MGDFLQLGVQEHIDAAQKETGHGRHPPQRLPFRRQGLQARNVGLCHLLIPGQPEQQGNIDVDALADELPDGGQALFGGRHLDQHVGTVQGLPQVPGLFDGAVGVVGQVGIDLQADEAVFAVLPVKQRPEHVRGRAHVRHGEGLIDFLDGLARLGQLPDVLVVVVGPGNGLVENRRIGGNPSQAVFIDKFFQFPGLDHLPADIIQPDALAQAAQFYQRVLAHSPSPISNFKTSDSVSLSFRAPRKI